MRLRDFQYDFNKNFKKIAGVFGSLTEDFTGSLDQAQIRRLLNSALDWVRPYHLAIGFRIRKLSRSQVEAVIPARSHNLNSLGEMEEGVLISVAHQMLKLLIARWELQMDAEVDQIRFERLQPIKGEMVARLEWDDLSREAMRAELVREGVTQNNWQILFSDASDRRVAVVEFVMKVKMPQSLSGKGSHGDHSKRN